MSIKIRKPPPLAKWLFRRMSRYEELYAITTDVEEVYYSVLKDKGYIRAVLWLWYQCFFSYFRYFDLSCIWSSIMFKNHLKIALRNFKRHKLFSFINVFGLAIGLATCMIITLWVQRELSYDRFHENHERIYRVERELFRDNVYSRWPIVSGAYNKALVDDYPEIESSVRIWRRQFSVKDHKNFVHRQDMYAVDNSVFNIFDFGLEEGDEKTALEEPGSVVLTRELAATYLGTENAVGKTLRLEVTGRETEVQITGILREVPENSHIHFDMLLSISTYSGDMFLDWRSNYLYDYILVSENTSKRELETKLMGFIDQHLKPVYGDLLNRGLGIHEVLKLHLVPVTDIHLKPSPNWEIEPQGSMLSVYIFSTIAILVLFIACINFVNLSTARARKRAREVGLRKTIGAQKKQLMSQFIQETIVLVAIVIPLTILILSLITPLYNHFFSEELSLIQLLQPQNLLIFTGITLTAGIIAGFYPAFYLTRFEPVLVLKGVVQSGTGKSAFRRNMVILQFIISTVLIIGMFTIYKQMKYIKTRNPGFDKENVLIVQVSSSRVAQNFDVFRNQLLASPHISSVAASSDIPGVIRFSTTNFVDYEQTNEENSLIILSTDYDFIDTYRMEILAGRNFSKEFSSDTSGTIILNESAVKKFGWTSEEAVGQRLLFRNSIGNVVGVVKDFNFRSVRSGIEPLALLLFPGDISYISVRIMPGDFSETIHFIQQKWADLFSGELFEFSFLDNRLNQLYENENKMQNIFLTFSCFSIFVACLGLFGLAAFTVEERTKEIGVRKVLGASTGDVFLLLTGEFTKWVMIANIVAWPISWFFMNKWLQNFSYKTDVGIFLFIGSAVITVIIALFTISTQTLKSAFRNPVDSIKYE